jgi:HEAT repeat protein
MNCAMRTAVIGVLVGAVGLAAGAQPAGNAGAGKGSESAQPPLSVLEISTLRETALNRIEELAKSPEAQIRANAVEASGQSPKRLGWVIEAGLGDTNLGVRTVACAVVGKLRLTALADRVSALTNDNSEYVRAAALYALKRCGQKVDITPLAGLLLDHPNPKLRAHAAMILGDLGEKSAVPMLRQAAASNVSRASEIEIRLMQLQAGEAMVKLGEDAALESIRAALYAARPDELEASVLAAQILGNLKDKGAARQLVNVADYVDTQDRKSRQPAELRLAAVGALAQMGYRDGAYVAEEYASDPNPAIRAQAAFVFGEIGGSTALRRLDGLMADPEAQVQLSAAAAVLKAAGK